MNRLTLVGRLTRDPELRSLEDGNSVCELRLAVDGVGDQPPLFLDVATFGRQADACAEHLSKGRQVSFDGRLVFREWKAQDGSPRSKHSAIGRVGFLDAKPSRGANGDQGDQHDDPVEAP